MTQPTERWGWVPLGQMLVQDGILTDEQLASALDRQRKVGYDREEGVPGHFFALRVSRRAAQ